ncbi:MAG: hypothetical protein UY21_C0001G0118 [Microgenomates group bacterium GW2011_GWA1_48_10]|nr:MAG: hypothetical protein UY21_C0001G0118 [Microgenomates group bacterium GW2011_GWA1_48_10]
MSRKTRRQKLAAEKRRERPGLQRITDTPVSARENTQYTFSASETAPELNSKQTGLGTLDYSYVLSDLKRIFVLATLAFCAQGVLWYFLK